MLYVTFFLILMIFILPPVLLTIMNIFFLIKDGKKKPHKDTEDKAAYITDKQNKEEDDENATEYYPCMTAAPETKAEKQARTRMSVDILIFILGIPYTLFLWKLLPLCSWNEAIIHTSNHMSLTYYFYTPINFDALPTVLTFACIAIAGFWALRLSLGKLPPLISALCCSSVFIGFILTIVWTVQILPGHNSIAMPLFLLLPINYCICSVRLLRRIISGICEKVNETEYKNPILAKCKRFVLKAHGFMLFSFVLMIPLILLTIIILVLFGQAPDSIVKAFTETAEWTLSQKIPPPRIGHDGHYLCTVAACGDEKKVKPLRAGKRHGQLIVVNRQLLVANAFEDLIKERVPRFHHFIRGIYDRYGLPISKHITTKKRSNAVYFLMKPLEWLFLLVLYTFDLSPENRIAIQYTK